MEISLFMLLLALIAGVALGVQGPVNTALGKRKDVFFATTVSFFGGMLTVGLITIIVGNGNFALISGASLWQLIGGMYGAASVCITISAMPLLGVALTITLNMLGQILMGAVIDCYGWFDSVKTGLPVLRGIGILVVAAGIVLIYFGSRDKENEPQTGMVSGFKRAFMIILVLISGVVSAMQSPTNASLAKIIGDWEGTFVSFAVGFLSILVVLIFVRFRSRRTEQENFPAEKSSGKIKPWMVTGGLLGATGIFLNVYTVQRLGTALQTASLMVGQLLAGIIIDSFGLIQSDKVKINPLRIAGVAVIAAGVILVSISA